MTTLFIDRKNSELTIDNDALIFSEHDTGNKIGTVPLKLLERICIHGELYLSASVLGKLGKAGVGVLILSGYQHEPTLLMPNQKLDAKRRIVQYQASLDDTFCLQQAKTWIESKIKQQIDFIKQNRQPENIEEILPKVNNAKNLDTLRGIESVVATQYFSVWQDILPASLSFTGRNRRPPKDPFNVVLSLGYTMLHFEAVRQILLLGLDPCIGFYHQLLHGRESLASDFIESLRPQYDCFAYSLFTHKILRPEHFSIKSDGCFMGKAGQLAFYKEVEQFFEQIEQPLREIGYQLLKDLQIFSGSLQEEFTSTWQE